MAQTSIRFTDLLCPLYADTWNDCTADIDWQPILIAMSKGDHAEVGNLLMRHIEKSREALDEEINMTEGEAMRVCK